MRQIIQHLRSGKTILEEIPVPEVQPGTVLIQTVASLVSAGTEKMLVEFSKANLISKARQQPQRVEQVLNKMKTDGLLPTLEAVFTKLDEPLPLGYCNAGIIIKVGAGVDEFKVGDRVASNGCHAEFVCVPKNLVVKIPGDVSFEEAAFAPVGAIALQGIRLIHPQLGDHVAVIGLGLIGLLTAQLLKASGVNVIGFDIEQDRIELAKQFGITSFNSNDDSPEQFIVDDTDHGGMDAVIITASSKQTDLVNKAAALCRKKGNIVLVGVTGIEIDRSLFYKKELSFTVSCSYGPGRYDEAYEEKGIDYPIAYVRYTAKRNFESFLDAVASKSIQLQPLISDRTQLDNYDSVYGELIQSKSIASILLYPEKPDIATLIRVASGPYRKSSRVIGIIGAGNYTRATMLPALAKTNAAVKYIASANGLNAKLLATKFGIANATTDVDQILSDPEVQLVMITTRHDQHASYIIKALEAGKHVFVEKPLCINEQQLSEIEACKSKHPAQQIFIGFNRRSAPFTQKAKQLIGTANDLNIVITVNAGKLPANHWLLDPQVGGGRIVGEGCHFFDLAACFAGSNINTVFATSSDAEKDPSWMIQLGFTNGARAVINYLTNGHKSYPKERIEIFSGGRILTIDNFRKLEGYGFKNFNSSSSKQNKGHREEFATILQDIASGENTMSGFDSMINTTKATFAAMRSALENRVITIV